jgi:hypothetical protein
MIWLLYCEPLTQSVSEDCDPVRDCRRGTGLGFKFRTTPRKFTAEILKKIAEALQNKMIAQRTPH